MYYLNIILIGKSKRFYTVLKKYEFFFSINQKILDLVGIFLTGLFSFWLRFYFMEDGQPGLELFFLQIYPIAGLLTLYCFTQEGLYKTQRYQSRFSEILAVFRGNSFGFLAIVVFLYFFFQDKVSRIFLMTYFMSSQFVMITLRILVRNYLRTIRKRGKNLRHILLIGSGNQMETYVESVKRFKDSGISFLGWIDSGGKSKKWEIEEINGSLDEVKAGLNPDAIIIGYSGNETVKVNHIVKTHYSDIIPLQILPDLSYALIGLEISHFAGVPIITLNTPKFSLVGSFLKRSFDLISTLIGVILISPLLFIIALLVKVTSKGSILYGQERMGLDGKTFMMWKFRSMKVDAEDKSGAIWAREGDPRRTPIGKFLRSSSLDELPQLFNVLKGDMSLVGPRPERPIFVEKFKNEIPNYMLRHTMKAGLTGWAQINGWRGNTSLEKRIEFDLFYIKNWSFLFDIKIIFLTFWKGFFNKNAY